MQFLIIFNLKNYETDLYNLLENDKHEKTDGIKKLKIIKS